MKTPNLAALSKAAVAGSFGGATAASRRPFGSVTASGADPRFEPGGAAPVEYTVALTFVFDGGAGGKDVDVSSGDLYDQLGVTNVFLSTTGSNVMKITFTNGTRRDAFGDASGFQVLSFDGDDLLGETWGDDGAVAVSATRSSGPPGGFGPFDFVWQLAA